jgi:hypothetical protein
MGSSESREKLAGIISRRRFQALAAAGVLSVGLGVGAASGAFASPAPQSLMADLTPVATAVTTPGTPAATSPAGTPKVGEHRPGGFGRFGRGHGGFGMMGGGFLGPVASFLGISNTDLQTELKNGQTLAQIAQAHGKTADDLKTFLLNQESSRIDKLINNKFPQPPAGGKAVVGGFRGGFLGADIATFLGISATDFRTALQSGQTPAQIAQAHGKTAADLKTYLQDQFKKRLDQAVTAGKITSQQETDQLNKVGTMIDKFINNAMPQRGHKGAGSGTPTAAPATATATSG